ncbi:MAG: ATP-binding protein [Candidatus Gracilibacteria bacterium]
MSFIFARYLVNPLERVIQATQSIAKGNYKSRVTSSRKDEVGDLCLAVNEMAGELEKMEQIRRDLVSNVAHELATPLTNIGGYLRAINDGTIEYGDEMKETLLLLESETDRLSNLVGDVRALYLVDSPKKNLELEDTDLNKLIREVVKNMRPEFESKALNLKMNLEEDLPSMKVDREKFIQVVMNLLANAIAYTANGGHIAVSTGRKNNEDCLSVKDDGIGISEEDLPYIFERFYRVDKSRSRKTGGTGVGLTIVKDLVEAHGGRIEVKSEPGKGSEFFIYL